jgi:hypothetical protein
MGQIKRSGSQPVDIVKVKEVGDCFKRGWTTDEVCAHFGIARSTATEYKRASGNVDRSNKRVSEITLQDVANVHEMRALGVTWTEISLVVGSSAKAIQRECRILELMGAKLPAPSADFNVAKAIGNAAWNALDDE